MKVALRNIVTPKIDNNIGALASAHICANIQVTRARILNSSVGTTKIMQSNQISDNLGNSMVGAQYCNKNKIHS